MAEAEGSDARALHDAHVEPGSLCEAGELWPVKAEPIEDLPGNEVEASVDVVRGSNIDFTPLVYVAYREAKREGRGAEKNVNPPAFYLIDRHGVETLAVTGVECGEF